MANFSGAWFPEVTIKPGTPWNSTVCDYYRSALAMKSCVTDELFESCGMIAAIAENTERNLYTEKMLTNEIS